MKSEEWRKESMSECNRFLSDSCRVSWNKASKAMQAKLDAKDKELEVFRSFANEVILGDCEYSNICFLPKLYNLVDDDNNPTKLLTGDK